VQLAIHSTVRMRRTLSAATSLTAVHTAYETVLMLAMRECLTQACFAPRSQTPTSHSPSHLIKTYNPIPSPHTRPPATALWRQASLISQAVLAPTAPAYTRPITNGLADSKVYHSTPNPPSSLVQSNTSPSLPSHPDFYSCPYERGNSLDPSPVYFPFFVFCETALPRKNVCSRAQRDLLLFFSTYSCALCPMYYSS
jgi:hypothetical protein